MNILHVCANPKPTEESASKQLSAAFFVALAQKNPEFEVNNIDLYQDPPPFLSYDAYRGFWYPVLIEGYQPTDEDKKAMEYALRHGEHFNNADVVVLSTPMWNYAIPSILKAWMDQVFSPGITFRLESDGPHPLHHVRRVILLAASGGTYKEDDPDDALSRQVRAAFSFLGITDIATAWADGQNTAVYHDSQMRKEMAIEMAQEMAEEVAEIV
jgi:FMN-dependent NADH-azoreductase